MPVIHEEDRRRDEWIEGRSIRLEDDQEWEFPLPRIAYAIGSNQLTEKNSAIDTNRRFSAQYWSKSDKLREFLDHVNDATYEDLARAVKPLAIDLLQRQYQLSDDEATDLLLLIPGDKRNLAMWLDIARLAVGQGPKS